MKYVHFFLQVGGSALIWVIATNYLSTFESGMFAKIFFIFAYAGAIAITFIAIRLLRIEEGIR